MAKECPFKPYTISGNRTNSYMQTYRGSNGPEMVTDIIGQYTSVDKFNECSEDKCMAWNYENNTCKRLDISNSIKSENEELINDKSEVEKLPKIGPCGYDCNGCKDYGAYGEFPCPDWVGR